MNKIIFLIPFFYLIIIVPVGHGLAPLFLFCIPGANSKWLSYSLWATFSSLGLIVFSIYRHQNVKIHFTLYPIFAIFIVIINLFYIYKMVGMTWQLSAISALPIAFFIIWQLFYEIRQNKLVH